MAQLCGKTGFERNAGIVLYALDQAPPDGFDPAVWGRSPAINTAIRICSLIRRINFRRGTPHMPDIATIDTWRVAKMMIEPSQRVMQRLGQVLRYFHEHSFGLRLG
jgi:hypothetical protein